MDDLLGIRRAIWEITGQDLPLFFGQTFGADFRPEVALDYLRGGVQPIDAALLGYAGRRLDTFYNYGAVPKAAQRIADAETALFVTGFNVPGNPPAPETDGIAGTAASMVMALRAGTNVRALTDAANNAALASSLRALGLDPDATPGLELGIVREGEDVAARAAAELDRLEAGDVVVAVELPGRNAEGGRANMRGIPIDDFNLPLDEILVQANRIDGIGTIAVGDGGNEAGMGAGANAGGLPEGMARLMAAQPPGSGFKPSVVPAEIVVTAPDSNLGAYAIGAQTLALTGQLERAVSPEAYWAAVEASVEAGAIDGVTLRSQNSVDGFPKEYHMLNLEHVLDALTGAWPPAPRPRPDRTLPEAP